MLWCCLHQHLAPHLFNNPSGVLQAVSTRTTRTISEGAGLFTVSKDLSEAFVELQADWYIPPDANGESCWDHRKNRKAPFLEG